jgi:hypothetical protein
MLTNGPPKHQALSSTPTGPGSRASGYTHKLDQVIIYWLIVSLPLVLWDSAYVFGRPYTMPGGKLDILLWKPYGIYGVVDYIYGFPAWNARNGFTAAQSALNLVETAFYGWYLYIIGRQSVANDAGSPRPGYVSGEGIRSAVLLCFSAAVMTVSKTVLYCEWTPTGQRKNGTDANMSQGSTSTTRTLLTSGTMMRSVWFSFGSSRMVYGWCCHRT